MENKRTDVGLGGKEKKGRQSNITEADLKREGSVTPNSTVEYMWYGQ